MSVILPYSKVIRHLTPEEFSEFCPLIVLKGKHSVTSRKRSQSNPPASASTLSGIYVMILTLSKVCSTWVLSLLPI